MYSGRLSGAAIAAYSLSTEVVNLTVTKLLILPAVVLPGISFSSFLVTSPIQSVPE
jgi:hypothetical protein